MNHIEAMKQALEAFLRVKEEFSIHQMDTAITALRTAIEAAENVEPVAYMMGHDKTISAWELERQPDWVQALWKDAASLYTTPPAAHMQVQTDWEAVAADQAMTIALLKSEAAAQPAQEEVQRLSALVRAQQITIEKLEAAPVQYHFRGATKLIAAQRQWVELTDGAVYAAAEVAWRAGWAACRDAEYVGEAAEDEEWGYQGATIAQDTETKLREKNNL